MKPFSSVIVALGAGLNGGMMARLKKRKDHRQYLSIGRVTRLRAAAAAALFHKHPDSLVIFSGGHTCGSRWISEAEAMRECVAHHKRFAVPRSHMMVETESPDSATNVRNVVALMRTLPLAKNARVTVIAGRRQRESVVAYFRALGFLVHPLLIRQALGAIARRYVIPKSVDARLTKQEHRRGRLLRFVRILDPRGALVSWLMRRRRKNRR